MVVTSLLSAIQLHPVLSITVDNKTAAYSLDQNRHEIGRSIQCGIRINHREVSRLQATITRDAQGRFQILDGDGITESSNGTYVNGSRIKHRVLQSGDVIHLGSSAVTAQFYQDQPLRTRSLLKAEDTPTDAHEEPTASIFRDLN